MLLSIRVVKCGDIKVSNLVYCQAVARACEVSTGGCEYVVSRVSQYGNSTGLCGTHRRRRPAHGRTPFEIWALFRPNPVGSLRSSNHFTKFHLGPYMHDTYPPYLDQGLIQAVSTVSGPRYSRYSMYCISLYLDRGLIQLIQYVSDCIHTVSYM